MAFFKGDNVPATYKRLAKLYAEHPEFVKVKEGDPMWEILERASDMMDDGVENDSTPFSPEPTFPITGVDGSIDITNYDVGTGNILNGVITPSVIPANTTDPVVYVYTSSDLAVATVDVSGNVTAVAEGSAIITLGIQGTAFEKDFSITVIETV